MDEKRGKGEKHEGFGGGGSKIDNTLLCVTRAAEIVGSIMERYTRQRERERERNEVTIVRCAILEMSCV